MRRGTQKNKYRLRAMGCRLQAHSGFSFIEVMLSVFLLSAGMVAAISLMGGALRESIDSRNQLIASLLAQEGVELVRNIRDNNWASGAPDSFSKMPTINADNCIINYNSTDLAICSQALLAETLSYSGGFYHTGANPKTKFKRKIRIDISGSDRIVTSMVIWKGSFPNIVNIKNITECTTGASCSYAQLTLTRWNE